MKRYRLYIAFCLLISFGCQKQAQKEDGKVAQEAASFLKEYTDKYVSVHRQLKQAEWNHYTGKLDSAGVYEAQRHFLKALSNKEDYRRAKGLLTNKMELIPSQIAQLNAILYNGARYVPDNAFEWYCSEKAFYRPSEELVRLGREYYKMTQLDSVFRRSVGVRVKEDLFQLARKQYVSKSKKLRRLRDYRNRYSEIAGYGNFYAYSANGYNLSARDVLDETIRTLKVIRPMMEELHTYLRYELAEVYKKPVPDLLPPHWLGNHVGADWENPLLSDVDNRMNQALKAKSKAWLQKQAELPHWVAPLSARRYFYYTEPLYFTDIDRDGDYRLNVTLEKEVESFKQLANFNAQAQYANYYTNPDVPRLLRKPLNEAIEIGVSTYSEMLAFDKLLELFPPDSASVQTEAERYLLREALEIFPQLTYYAGVLTQFEFAFYANDLDAVQFNFKWWELQTKYLGVAPPSEVSSAYCDPLLEQKLVEAPFASFHEMLGLLIAYDMREKLNDREDQKVVLQKLLRFGAAFNWQESYTENLGRLPRAQSILSRFEPLRRNLKFLNRGRAVTLPEWE